MVPSHIALPEHLTTDRMFIRCPREADAPAINDAVCESLVDLRPWMPWAQSAPTLEASQADCRRLQAQFLTREHLPMFMFERRADGGEGRFIGGAGLHRILWDVRRFEIGYWCRTMLRGQGFVGEAVAALNRFSFDQLRARRVEVRMDPSNERSWRVAERAGFTLEGTLRMDSLNAMGEPRDTRVYARVRGAEEPSGAPP